MPRKLKVSVRFIFAPLNSSVRCWYSETFFWWLWNIMYLVLPTLSDSLLICNQSFIRDSSKLMRLPSVAISSFDFGLKVKKVCSVLSKEVSSANIMAWKFFDASEMSLIYMRKRRGPRTDPCGTPVVTFWECDVLRLYVTCCILSLR